MQGKTILQTADLQLTGFAGQKQHIAKKENKTKLKYLFHSTTPGENL